jgi:hypothetical protein
MKFKSKPVKVEQRPPLPATAMPYHLPTSQPHLTMSQFGTKMPLIGSPNLSTDSIVAAAVRSLSPLPPSGLVSMQLTSPLPLQTFLNLKPESELMSPAVSPPSFVGGQILMQSNKFSEQKLCNSKHILIFNKGYPLTWYQAPYTCFIFNCLVVKF